MRASVIAVAVGALFIGSIAGFFVGRKFQANIQPSPPLKGSPQASPEADAPAAAKSDTKFKGDAFMRAAEVGQVGIVEQLLKGGINVNDKDAEGQTALMRASAKGQLGVVQTLVDHKALMAERDNLGETAAIKAARNGHRSVLSLFKGRHNEGDQHTTIFQLWAIRDKEGRTALVHAAMEGHVEIVGDLLYADAKVPDKHGKTALMYAAEKGDAAIVQVMLSGIFKVTTAYVNLVDSDGRTALKIAEQKGYKEIVDLLKKEN